jgi:hypothetical protein
MKGVTLLWGTRVPDPWDENPPRLLELSKAVAHSVRDGIERRWMEQRAIEIAFAEQSKEYEGEQTLHPGMRRPVDECKTKLVELRETVLQWCRPFALPEPTEDVLRLIREVVFPEQHEARLAGEAAAAEAGEA